jgi:hypothetical protein
MGTEMVINPQPRAFNAYGPTGYNSAGFNGFRRESPVDEQAVPAGATQDGAANLAKDTGVEEGDDLFPRQR